MADQRKNDGGREKNPGKEASRKAPGSDNSPGRGGYSHADTRMGHEHSQTLADLEHAVTGSAPPRGKDESGDADAMSRASKPRSRKPDIEPNN